MQEITALDVDSFILYLGNGHGENRLDEASQKLVYDLFCVVNQLKPMGDDELRKFWIRVHRPEFQEYCERSFSEDEEYTDEQMKEWYLSEYPDDEKWYKFSSVYYRDPYTGEEYYGVGLNDESILSINPKEKPGFPIDVTEVVNWLIIEAEKVVEDTRRGDYNQFIKDCLPDKYKYGTILRKDFWNIYPDEREAYLSGFGNGEVDEFLTYKPEFAEKYNEKGVPDNAFNIMTARLFYETCAIGYRAAGYENREKWKFEDSEEEHKRYGEDTPKELYYMHADGRDNGLKDVPLDDPLEFEKWCREEGDYYSFNGNHPYEVVTSGSIRYSIHLYPQLDKDSARWFFGLSGDAYSTSIETIKFYLGLKREGIPVVLYNGLRIAARLEETDRIGILPDYISPFYAKYGSGVVGYEVLDHINLMGREKPEMVAEKANWIEQEEVRLQSVKHKSLEERIEEHGGELNLTTEYDWGEPRGRELW